MVPFAGYDMPVQYPAGVMKEHEATRASCGLFDVSHMGQAWLRGPGAIAALERLVPGDLASLASGAMRYTFLTNDEGGILDDMMVCQCGGDLFLVVNAARKEVDFAHIQDKVGDQATLDVLEDRALIALQGPKAGDVVKRYLPAAQHMVFMTGERLHINDTPCFVTRSSYAGEDGYEISLPSDAALDLAELMLSEDDVSPVGLGARDSLRLEAGLCLHGQDIDETTTPVEAGLAWAISPRRREAGGFPGADVIQRQLAEGAPRRLVGIKPETKAPARAGTVITDPNGFEIGAVTSGGFGPTVGGPIAMGYVTAGFERPGQSVKLMVRDKALPAHVVKLPFIEKRYVKA